ncbi:MAG: Ig domain-containing protein, partial [Chitinivibrionales bacterium]|nr:Ig domain-containing protein [Chitinivibrionales bacterium]
GISAPFKIIKQLTIQKKKLNSASIGRYYKDSLTIETGIPPFGWSIINGYLPASLYLDSLTGIISGVAHTKGLFPFTVTLIDAELHTAPDTFSILVDSIIVGQNLSVPFSDTNAVNPNAAIADTFILQNDTLPLTYSLFANRADGAPVKIDSLMDSVRLPGGKKALIALVPGAFVNDSVGSRVFFVVSNGSIIDTVPVSHRVKRDTNNCDNIGVGDLEWTPLSVTAELDKNDIQSVLGCFNTQAGTWKYDKSRFRIIYWYPYFGNDTSSNKWVEGTPDFASLFKFEPGKLFWIKSNEARTIDFGKAITPSLSSTFTIPLNANQWTDFAVPFNFPILLQDIINATKSMTLLDKSFIDALEIYQWQKSGKTWIAVLIRGPGIATADTVWGGAGKAYTVYNPKSANILQIPPVCAAMSSTGLAKKRDKTQNGSWSARFDFRMENGNGLNPIFLGYSPNAGLSNYLPRPPSFTDVTVSVFNRSLNKSFGHAFVRELSGGGMAQEFMFENKTGKAERISGLADKNRNLPDGYEIRFFKPQGGALVSEKDSFSVLVPANGKQFVFAALGKKEYLANFNKAFGQYKTQLMAIYSNPINPKLVVAYSLSYIIEDIKEINFTIYDLSGRIACLKKVTAGFNPGKNLIFFDKKNSLGQKLSSGIYLVRMSVVHNNAAGNEVFNKPIPLIE